jgi:adenosylcobinamide kinase/adenosylcobinamide-phosphate guanylyltransferase
VITLVLGGTRSGKSAVAEKLALRNAAPVLYIATGAPTDVEMRERIDAHKGRRDERFTTVEAGAELIATLGERLHLPALVDSLGTWVAHHDDFAVNTVGLTTALSARAAPTVVVSDEVGFGVHPSTLTGRRFRDALGEVNQAVAETADDVLLVAGRVLPLAAMDDQ